MSGLVERIEYPRESIYNFDTKKEGWKAGWESYMDEAVCAISYNEPSAREHTIPQSIENWGLGY